MKTGDLVKCDAWVHGGSYGVVIKVQEGKYCRAAFILLDTGVKLIRLGNLLRVCDD